ncbi:MAG: S26 family signal peptidase [Acholeplasmataceae bacterium]|nr:S26 family signal peptidase [Acholeplasmataceae bacterium]
MKIIKTVTRIILFAFLGLTIYLIVNDITSKKPSTPALFGYSILVINGDSMEDTIKDKDVVIIKKRPQYWEFSIITFYLERNQSIIRVTHRIIDYDQNNDIYYTQGDKSRFLMTNDNIEQVSSEDVIGEVIAIIPWIGNILSFKLFQNKVFILILLIILLIITIILYILIFLENLKNKKYRSRSNNGVSKNKS